LNIFHRDIKQNVRGCFSERSVYVFLFFVVFSLQHFWAGFVDVTLLANSSLPLKTVIA